jgi:hypothetical protein
MTSHVDRSTLGVGLSPRSSNDRFLARAAPKLPHVGETVSFPGAPHRSSGHRTRQETNPARPFAPWPADVDFAALIAGPAGHGLTHPMRRVFHAPDVPDNIVIADMTKKPGSMGPEAPWSTDYSPGGPALQSDPGRGPLGPGVVATESAAITTPVFIAAGDIDVVGDPRAEPRAYPSSRDITVCMFPRMGHMHNFATTRLALWDGLAAWTHTVVAKSARR